MSRLILNEQTTVPGTPASGKVSIYTDNTSTPRLRMVDDAGTQTKILDGKSILMNSSTANQTGFATNTYLTGSSIAIPSGRLPAAKFRYHLVFDMVKTAAGTATPILYIRFGTAGTTADTARLTFTWGAGTAATDTGVIEVWAHFRTVGASAVLQGVASLRHARLSTGLTTTSPTGVATLIVTSGAFDSTVANSIIGASFNGGSSFSGTNTLVQADAMNLNL